MALFTAIVRDENGKRVDSCGHEHMSEGAAQKCGGKKFDVTGFELYVKQPKPKHKSRAARAGEASSNLMAAVEAVNEAKQLVDDYVEAHAETSESYEGEVAALKVAVNERLQNADKCASEAQSELTDLADEMETWESNMSGNDMTHLPKYEEVEQSASSTREVVDALEDANEPKFPDAPDSANLEDYSSELEEYAGALESVQGDVDGLEFPGMF